MWSVMVGARLPRVVRLLPGVLALVVGVATLLAYDVSLADSTRYLLAVLWSVLLPGILVHRALRGRPDDLITELVLGFVLGLACQLIAWAILVGVGAGRLLIGYPLLVLAAFLIVPQLRCHLGVARYRRTTPVLAAWSLTGLFAFTTLTLAGTMWASAPLPPGRARWYQDLYWHLAITAQAKEHVPPVVPQLGDVPLKYHWYSNAHMAATSWVSGVDALQVTARLWYVPFYALLVLATYALTCHLSRSATAGVLAATVLSVSAALLPLAWVGARYTSAYTPMSPSQIMAVPPLLIGVWLIIDTLRRRPTPGGWAALTLVLLLCAGSKSSNLPTLAAGAALATLVGLRDPGLRRRGLLTTAVIVLVTALSATLLAGGSSGSTLGWLTTEYRHSAVHQIIAVNGPKLWMLYLLAAALTLQFAYLLLGLGAFNQVPRTDPAPWVILGTFGCAMLAMQVIDHISLSQVYFTRGALAAWAVLTGWGTVAIFTQAHQRWSWATLGSWSLGGAVLGAVAILAARHLAGAGTPLPRLEILRSTIVLTSVAVLVLCVAGAALWLRHHQRPGADLLSVAGAAALIVACVVPAVAQQPLIEHGFGKPSMSNALTPAQIAGTTWLRTRTPPRDLIATNVHCQPTQRKGIGCDARAYWVTGLGERAAYLEGWGYTDQNQQAAVRRTYAVPYAFQPFWDPARLRLNDNAFRNPTRPGLQALYGKRVRWLFADRSAGPVSPGLDDLATLRFRRGEISIYQLRR